MGVSETHEPVLLNPWNDELENPHLFIGGVTGSGKSYLGKLLVERDLLLNWQRGDQCFVIDPDLEYQQLAEALGGTVVRLAPGSAHRLNPFDLLPPRCDFRIYLEEATQMSDRSLGIQQTFQNLRTRAELMEKKGDARAANEFRTKALPLAGEADLNQYAYGLLGQKKIDEAIVIFVKNVEAHPASWNVYDSLGEAYAIKGDRKLASENYRKALNLVKDDANRKRIEQTLERLKGK